MHYLLRDFGLPVAIAILLLSWPPVCLRSNLHANSGGILCARAGKKQLVHLFSIPLGQVNTWIICFFSGPMHWLCKKHYLNEAWLSSNQGETVFFISNLFAKMFFGSRKSIWAGFFLWEVQTLPLRNQVWISEFVWKNLYIPICGLQQIISVGHGLLKTQWSAFFFVHVYSFYCFLGVEFQRKST